MKKEIVKTCPLRFNYNSRLSYNLNHKLHKNIYIYYYTSDEQVKRF